MSVRQGPTRIFSTAVIIALMVACAAAVVSQRQAIRARWYAHRLAQAESPADLARYAGILAAMGPSARKPALNLLDNPRPDIRVLATLIVGRLADPAAAEALLKALSDPELDVRVSAAAQLGLLPDSARLLPQLLDAVGKEPRPTAMAAVLAIEKISAPTATEAMQMITQSHPDPVIRAQAAESLGRRRDPTSMAVLVGRLDDDAAVDVQLLGEFRDEQAMQAIAVQGRGLPESTPARVHRTVADVAERSLEKITGKTYTPSIGPSSPANRTAFWKAASPLDPASLPADFQIPASE